ncbi:uncharacterized protein E0L32_007335 [Thyridium curvatum]|uniref:Uncharacterized protein n=1 Tax=Thyridium curvatum TaxID=1093900 RepID=A0A507APZ5_9PEZI|nr:uncharacterized protein E0L32_007335 [Thyridium curvatum]TPX12032.1 hypothetical protein E0L32_007335 [Thyridium curvatum]
MHQPPAHPNLLGIPVVPVEQPLGDPLVPALPPKDVHVALLRRVGRPAALGVHERQADELRVKVHPDLERPDRIPQADDLGPAPRGEVQHLVGAQPGAVVPRRHGELVADEARLPRRLEHAGAVPAAHVRAQPDVDAHVLDQPPHARQPGRDGAVAARAVRHLGPAALEERRLRVGQVHRVREDRPLAEQARLVVYAGVRRAAGEQPGHERDLGGVLADVRLHGQARLAVQVAQRAQRLGRARRREARRDDGPHRLHPRVRGADVRDAGAGRRHRGLGRLVAVEVGRGPVHAHPPHEGALARREADVGEQVRRRHVDGRKVGRRRRAVRERLAHAPAVDAPGLGQVRERCLERERVRVEPVQQRGLAKDAIVRVLRSVEEKLPVFAGLDRDIALIPSEFCQQIGLYPFEVLTVCLDSNNLASGVDADDSFVQDFQLSKRL